MIERDAVRIRLLRAVRDLELPDCWIAAGFVRNAIWDHLHERSATSPDGDVDVIWFDRSRMDTAVDREFETRLTLAVPGVQWSVKNQARMHLRNGDRPYASASDAMRYWPETATAVAVRLKDDGKVELSAPLGLDDLLGLRLRPTASFAIDKRDTFDARVAAKGWLDRYPLLNA